jgi:hypothetical protein
MGPHSSRSGNMWNMKKKCYFQCHLSLLVKAKNIWNPSNESSSLFSNSDEELFNEMEMENHMVFDFALANVNSLEFFNMK